MEFTLLQIHWMDDKWVGILNIETRQHDGALLFLGWVEGRFQLDFMWFRFISWFIKDYIGDKVE